MKRDNEGSLKSLYTKQTNNFEADDIDRLIGILENIKFCNKSTYMICRSITITIFESLWEWFQFKYKTISYNTIIQRRLHYDHY